MKKKCLLIFLLLFQFCILNILSQPTHLNDSAKISLLTSAPWDGAIYALFGHTAIRVNDSANNIDYVFNYGVFDFNSNGFMYRFVKGETDYILNVVDFRHYLFEYQMREVSVIEQVLNLTLHEKQLLWEALCTNALPQNRTYRYNYFFDNCTTRARDIIERNIHGNIQYIPTNKSQSLRDLVYECVSQEPWTKFGIDLVIGSDADKVATDRKKMFLPVYLQNAYSGATIISLNGGKRNAILEEHYILRLGKFDSFQHPDYALITGVILLVITILISILNYKGKLLVIGKCFDTLLFLLAGSAGCVIAFLMFISVHPCTNPNWNLAWLNPLQLIFSLLFFVKGMSKYIYYYHFINFGLLSLFLLGWYFIPQHLNLAFIPFILSLWARSGTNIVKYKKGNIK